MTAQHEDITLESGSDFELAVRFARPSKHRTKVEDLTPGDLIFFGRSVWPVYSVEVDGGKKLALVDPGTPVTLRLGRGTLWEPKVRTVAGETALRASYEILDGAMARFAPPSPAMFVAGLEPPETLEIPTSIEDSGTTVYVRAPAAFTASLAAMIDFGGWGPSGFSAPWDLTVSTGGSNVRLIEGSMSLIRSTSMPIIDPSAITHRPKPGAAIDAQYQDVTLPRKGTP